MNDHINPPEPHDWTGEEMRREYEQIEDRRKLAKIFCLPLKVINKILQPERCWNKDCPFNKGNRCPAKDGCAGYERRK